MLHLFDIPFPEQPRWVSGDQYIRKVLRKVLEPIRGKTPGGLAKVTKNLALGLQRLGVEYSLCKRAKLPESQSLIGILHGPQSECEPLAQTRACIVGPGIINSPKEWPDLFTNSKAVYNIQNCEWAAALCRVQYGDRVKIWAMGVDQEHYAPRPGDPKIFDFLIYDKIRWRDTPSYAGLLKACQAELGRAGYSSLYIAYGKYPRGRESAYHEMLRQCRAMLFLSENETQGFAYNEALSMNVPILAWNCGKWCDPIRFRYGLDDVPATSIPYWDDRCGVEFRAQNDFPEKLGLFMEKLQSGRFAPREYVLENLRLEQSAQRYLDLVEAAREEAR